MGQANLRKYVKKLTFTTTDETSFLRPLILLIEAPERAAKHPGVLHRGCLAVGHI